MRILLTNDDAWESPGLAALVDALAGLGEVVIVAPREEMSAAGCAITLHGSLEAERVGFAGASAAWAVRGTPSDCAKLAIRNLLADAPPRLCVSGLNRGPNVGVNVFYSGTVGAALEAAVNGVPAVAVSKDHGERLSAGSAAALVAPLIKEVLKRGLPPWHVLNVNVPDRPPGDVRGIRLTRQGVSGFVERYREAAPGGANRDAQDGQDWNAPSCEARTSRSSAAVRRFVLEGEMQLREGDGTTDAEALAEGFVSVTPMALDLTARAAASPPGAATDWSWIPATPLGRP